MTEPKPDYLPKQSVAFNVVGIPRPKQSFRYGNRHGYQPERVTDWQDYVRYEAKAAMAGRPPFAGSLEVFIDFWLPDKRRRDLDNLSKGVLDACNGIVWVDDQQVTALHLVKHFNIQEPGCTVGVEVL